MADEKKAIDYLKESYASNMDAQKANLEQNYNKSVANLNEQKIAGQQNAQTNLNRTAVEAQKARNNFAETQNAYGLTSGAMAQARLAQNNTEAANMTAIRTKQQENDAQLERQRGLLADQYNSAIREAQANNDYKLAQALYAEAKEKEQEIAQQQALAQQREYEQQKIAQQQAFEMQKMQAQYEYQQAAAAAAAANKSSSSGGGYYGGSGGYSGFSGATSPASVTKGVTENIDSQAYDSNNTSSGKKKVKAYGAGLLYNRQKELDEVYNR